MNLRPYQIAVPVAVRARFAAGDRSTLIVLATGLGKTVIAAEILRLVVAKGGRALFLAHREELLDQTVRKLEAIGVRAGIEQAGRRAGDAPVVVASVATLRGPRLATWAPDTFALVVVDECQHAPAASYQEILAHFAVARVLGLTATPDRADGTPLGDTFASVAYRYDLREAIRDRWLAPITARRVVVDDVDLSEVATRAGDLAQNQLAAVMEDARAVAGVVAPVLEHAGDRPTIVFAASVAHAQAIAAAINAERPGAAAVVWGAMDRDERRRLIAAYSAGELQFLCNVDVLTEGFDAPRTSCVVMARPTKSRARYVQAVGRGTRLAEGKTDCLVLDVTGTAGRHRLVGPADCLAGGPIDDGVRRELEQLLGAEARNVDEALAAAEAAAQAQRLEAARAAVVSYHVEQIDPFVGDGGPPRRAIDTTPATEEQLERLVKLGAKKLPLTLTRDDADWIIQRLVARRRDGLCTLGQARQLARAGINPRAVTHERATTLITKLKDGGWKPWALANEPEVRAARPALDSDERKAS